MVDLLVNLASKSNLSAEDIELVPHISKENIQDWLKNQKKSKCMVLNLKLLLTLHENDQLQLSTYLHFCSDDEKFAKLLLHHVVHASEERLCLVSDVLSILISVQNDQVISGKYCTAVNLFILDVCEELVERRVSGGNLPLGLLVSCLATSPYRIPRLLHEFLAVFGNRLIDQELSRQPHEKFISNQKNEFAKLRDDCVYQFFEEALKVWPTMRAASFLQDMRILERESPTLLTSCMIFVSAYLHSGETNANYLLDYIDRGFKSALSGRKENADINSLLLIRHCCLEQVKPMYASYAQWFSSLAIKNKEEFEFFFGVLSKIVPHENAIYLKIHINKAPSIPANCQTIFSDYCQLAKTQLIDLNETVEYLGLFGTTEHEDRQDDVRRVLSHYQDSQAIAPILLKACVFRRDYYRDVFLRDLLAMREPALSQAQVSLVQALHAAGKMPAAMYDAWPLKPAS